MRRSGRILLFLCGLLPLGSLTASASTVYTSFLNIEIQPDWIWADGGCVQNVGCIQYPRDFYPVNEGGGGHATVTIATQTLSYFPAFSWPDGASGQPLSATITTWPFSADMMLVDEGLNSGYPHVPDCLGFSLGGSIQISGLGAANSGPATMNATLSGPADLNTTHCPFSPQWLSSIGLSSIGDRGSYTGNFFLVGGPDADSDWGGQGSFDLQFPASPIPEPRSIFLLGSGAVALVEAIRRKMRA